MKVDRIIFWQPFASPHQEAFLEAVAEQFPGDVILAVEHDPPPARIAQGWRKSVTIRVTLVAEPVVADHSPFVIHPRVDALPGLIPVAVPVFQPSP